MRENCTYGSMRGRAFPTGRPALLYTLDCTQPAKGQAGTTNANANAAIPTDPTSTAF